ncbi:Poly(A) polymerase [Thraustotheca clavata]|uniref:Poly(A) polymerase n=1 Tax=Thraustotheca clavata TaxID=74557 RepID=A0A1W0A4D4_9STRA|nr:Poly(A) polymerase [Thraustotheca clavata]
MEHVWFIKQSYEFTEIIRVLLKAPAQTALTFHHTKAFLALLKVLQWTTWFWTLKPTKLSTLVHGDLMESTFELMLAICTRRNCSIVLKWCELLTRLNTCNPNKHDASKIKRIAEEMQALSVEFNKEHQMVDRQIPIDSIESTNQAIIAYYLRTRVDETDEVLRQAVVDELQCHIKKYFDSKCQLYLYGSSLSLFGSKGCDIDITIVRKRPSASHNGIGQARRNYEEALKAADMATRCAEALDQIKSDYDKALTAHDKILEKCPKDSTKMPDKLRNQLKRSEFFCNSLKTLVKVTESLAQTAPSERESLVFMKESLKAAVAEAEAQRKVMFRLSSVLTTGNCTIQQMILGARVPIIKFVHNDTEFECDICIGNTLPTKNTMLLRTYGLYDPRVRPLVIAVKRWAKARRINDASMGTLSSYSYALLVIHVLQHYGVIPNLQDPKLLEELQVPHETLNEHDVTFCSDIEKLKKVVQLPNTSHLSIAELLQKFFCYLHNFDWGDQTIAIHRSTFDDLVSDAPKPLTKKEKKEAARAARKEDRKKSKKKDENKPNQPQKKSAPEHHEKSEKKEAIGTSWHSKPKHENKAIVHSPKKKKANTKAFDTKESKSSSKLKPSTVQSTPSPAKAKNFVESKPHSQNTKKSVESKSHTMNTKKSVESKPKVADAKSSNEPMSPGVDMKKSGKSKAQTLEAKNSKPKKVEEAIFPPPAPTKSLFLAPTPVATIQSDPQASAPSIQEKGSDKAKKNKWRKRKQPAKDHVSSELPVGLMPSSCCKNIDENTEVYITVGSTDLHGKICPDKCTFTVGATTHNRTSDCIA